MPLNDRNAVIELVEQHYFGNVANADIPAVLACFCPDAAVLIRHGDNPARHFAVQANTEATDLEVFYRHLCGTFRPWFGEFEHFIDIERQRAACYFTVKLTPKSPEMLADIGVQELRNCNFFLFEDNLIRHMTIYYSNTAADASRPLPTGYPQ